MSHGIQYMKGATMRMSKARADLPVWLLSVTVRLSLCCAHFKMHSLGVKACQQGASSICSAVVLWLGV
jgi:hypothetical protein